MTFSLQNSDSLAIPTPRDFNFWHTAFSHGWCALPPFSHDRTTRTLSRIFSLRDSHAVACSITSRGSTVRIHLTPSAVLTPTQQKSLVLQVRTCLRLDEDFREFHREARRYPAHRWIANSGAGRLLRAPTVFEDAVKMICTTNCTWALTTLMVSNLVQSAGARAPGGGCAFPTAEAIARLGERILRKEVKAGYRAPYIASLAEAVASEKLDIESWRHSHLSTDQLFLEMRSVKGIGPYAAGNLLKLVGRYDYLGLDSWVRARYYELHRKGRKVKDGTLERDYDKYGKWRGLIFWLEMTRDWHQDKYEL